MLNHRQSMHLTIMALSMIAILALWALVTRHNIPAQSGWRPSSQLKVFVGILSRSERREAREAIRATWASHPSLHRVLFFLARTPDVEQFEKVKTRELHSPKNRVLNFKAKLHEHVMVA
jgi:hypothetical protein